MSPPSNGPAQGGTSESAIQYLIYHVFLPPVLPQSDDNDPEHPGALLREVEDALWRFSLMHPQATASTLASARRMLSFMQSIHTLSGGISDTELRRALSSLQQPNGPIGVVAVHVHAQNAGVVFTQAKDGILIESFELSSTNEAAISAKGRLIRHFPAQALKVKREEFHEPGFLDNVAETLAKMSQQQVVGSLPQVRKAGRFHDEDRDSCDPWVVTELFMGCVAAKAELASVEALTKHTRDEVLWNDARLPWRRSPTWLLIRVALQLTLSRQLLPSGNQLYKEFMLFFMSRILQKALQSSTSSETLFAMKCKVSRRLLKLHSTIHEPTRDFVSEIMGDTQRKLSERWQNIQDHEAVKLDQSLARLTALDFERDTAQNIPALDAFIEKITNLQANPRSNSFTPTSSPIACSSSDTLPDLRVIGDADKEYMTCSLHSFEDWISSSLTAWIEVQLNSGSEDVCALLKDRTQQYHSLARSHYAGRPEGISCMILTIFELWVACDKAAIRACPLLQQYDPILPSFGSILDNLLLPFKHQMERLQNVQSYLKDRQASHSIFLEPNDPNSFAVRYFDSSIQLQQLHTQIVQQANERRQTKLKELSNKKAEYQRLMALYNSSECKYQAVVEKYTNRFGELREETKSVHQVPCTKCSSRSKANGLRIEVHEWPLPTKSSEAKAVVFELQVPKAVASWRDTTVFLLVDVLQVEHTSTATPTVRYQLQQDPHLRSRFRVGTARQRVNLLSDTKANVVTHRKAKLVGTTDEPDICLQNGMRYRYFDDDSRCFIKAFEITFALPHSCTYSLANKALQKFIFRPAQISSGPEHNTVIATQSACPPGMPLETYKDLSSLSLGSHLLWFNILVQIAAPSIDFNDDDTAFVIWQCIYQAGPQTTNADALRANHVRAASNRLATKFCLVLYQAIERIQGNWESATSLCIFASVASRLLSIRQLPSTPFLSCLNLAREVCFSWAEKLFRKSYECTNDKDRAEFERKCVEIALICAVSFDADGEDLAVILDKPENVSVLIQISIIIYNGRQALSRPSSLMETLRLRFERLLHRTCTHIARNHDGLDDGINRSWPVYRNGSTWAPLLKPYDFWLVTHTAPFDMSSALKVHYNLLTGQLLVNGLPLRRPPQAYEQQSLYSALFGNAAVEVMPSALPGMQFSVKTEYNGHVVHLTLLEANTDSTRDLIVHASKDDQVYYTVPGRLFKTHLQPSFVKDFVHWYDPRQGSISFQPINDPWGASSALRWTLSRCPNSSQWRLIQDGKALIALHSDTTRVISQILSPLADPANIHIALHSDGSKVGIAIPTLRLGFSHHANSNLLHSIEYPGMSVDTDQSLGCLIGLNSRLLLKHDLHLNRLVLIPEGDVSYQKKNRPAEHTMVSVAKDSITAVHRFDIDEYLGKLRDTGNLHSKLFLARLHALTSFCLPDPFTLKTGTEQALVILESAAARSFEQLTTGDMIILQEIARLTPGRSYYPRGERVMQRVTWDPELAWTSQHPRFYKTTKSFLAQEMRSRVFYPDATLEIPDLNFVDEHLLERDCSRSSTFHISGFGAEDFTPVNDLIYDPRDHGKGHGQSSATWQNSYIKSKQVYNGLNNPQARTPSSEQLLEILKKSTPILSVNAPTVTSTTPISMFKYDGTLLSTHHGALSQFLRLHERLRSPTNFDNNKFNLAIWFSSLAHSEIDNSVLEILVLCYSGYGSQDIDIPQCDGDFHLDLGDNVTLHALRSLIQSAKKSLSDRSPEASIPRLKKESDSSFDSRRQKLFNQNSESAIDAFATALQHQWPCQIPNRPSFDATVNSEAYINIDRAYTTILPFFKERYKNLCFRNYVSKLVKFASSFTQGLMSIPDPCLTKFSSTARQKGYISTEDLFAIPAPHINNAPAADWYVPDSTSASQMDCTRLDNLIQTLGYIAKSNLEKQYVRDLECSTMRLRKRDPAQWQEVSPITVDRERLQAYHQRCVVHLDHVYSVLESVVATHFAKYDRPCISPALLLEQLNRKRWPKLGPEWRHCIVQYGLAMTALQRADRLLKAHDSPSKGDLIRELENIGHQNWSPFDHPEFLLMEVESSILIREVQYQIAQTMSSPPDDSNAIVQLNMGEGKSTVIVPMSASVLADGEQLVRVIVSKPQSKQMAEMLIAKLGGLLDRRIYYLPFSRALRPDASSIQKICTMVQECMDHGGVLLVQPEHILSFQLAGIENCASSNGSIGKACLSLQNFFNSSSRDIVDESDENFSVKFELVYTMGTQRPIEMSPVRWILIQQILDLVRMFVPNVLQEHPTGLEVKNVLTGNFPQIRVLRSEAGENLFCYVAEYICRTGLDGFPLARLHGEFRDAVFDYITKPELTPEQIAKVEAGDAAGLWTDGMKTTMLLLRGLLSGGVLSFALGQKRWRVHYGLAPTRTRLAVPYRAKDQPTLRSEFSHPDVVITLTLLCYYYDGLNDEDLFDAFNHLVRNDQKEVEYSSWVDDAANLPFMFAQLQGINLRDRQQCRTEVFPCLRNAKSVVDYFVSNVVFPKEMREFPQKLSASGWDIGKSKHFPTTGFSGTNDSRVLLPLDMTYCSLPQQELTNALVLHHLLREDNSVTLARSRTFGDSFTDAERLLHHVINLAPPVQVILDVGAQIIELENEAVARKWLDMHPNDQMKAVIYFNDADELSVLDRKGCSNALQSSPYATQPDACLVFLDEAHTRGTDLKLPYYYRAAVTLGPGISKDKLVQACMRLRKLGKGQTVVFYITKEIETKIRQCTSKLDAAGIEIEDVLIWAISETWTEIRRMAPLWASQGARFGRHDEIWSNASDQLSMSKEKAELFLEDEAQSLEARYRPHGREETWMPQIEPSNPYHARIMAHNQQFEDVEVRTSTLSEEQERELAPEVEEERQVQRATPAEPEQHTLHQDVTLFATGGVLIRRSKAYTPAFQALGDTSGAATFEVAQLIGAGRLLATADFIRTVKKGPRQPFCSDSFQRSVQWVVSNYAEPGNDVDYLMIISPYEAQRLLPKIEASTKTALHLYRPRVNKAYPSFDKLDFFTISGRSGTTALSRSLAVQLDLFAGQLYVNSIEDYREVCAFLGLAPDETPTGWTVAADGFVLDDGTGQAGAGSGLHSSPVEFLRLFIMRIRRNSEGIDKTHMGSILNGKVLHEDDFETTEEDERA